MKKEVYPPREDSFLLKRNVKKLACGKVLDVGCGSGIQSKAALKSKKTKKVISVDLNENALKETSKINDKRLKTIKSNLFSSLKKEHENSFDLILFNPPYLPKSNLDHHLDEGTRLATVGGIEGNEVINRFITELNRFLKNDGKCLLLYSSKSNPIQIEKFMDYNLLNWKLIDSEKMEDDEELYVVLIKKSNLLKRINKKHYVKFISKGKHSYIFLTEDKKLIKVTNGVSKGSIKTEFNILKAIENSKFKEKINYPKPYYLDEKNQFLIREYISGIEFNKKIEKIDKIKTKKILKQILTQAFYLDKIGINKKEMHRITKNVIITKNNIPYLIDFERSRKTNNPKNVTQFISFLYKFIKKDIIKINEKELIKIAKKYSNKPDIKYINEILEKW